MSEFEDIRPYHDDEVEGVIKKLLRNSDLLDFVGKYHSPRLAAIFPILVRYIARLALSRALGDVKSIREFQEVIAFYAKKIVTETSDGFEFLGIEPLEKEKAYLFIGNHRDIAGDSMLVDYALWQSGRDTVRIAVGDNLIQREFATDLMKLNKSFFIRRSEEGAKKVYAAILESSRYIYHSLNEGQSIWIAQSEGRAKDGLDVTDPIIIKMFAVAKRKQALSETLKELCITPVSISYEFDPCDYLKAKELYTIEKTGSYEKPSGEDLLSLVKGLGENKGRIRLKFGKTILGDFQTAEEVASAVDRQVLDNYQLYYINFWALQKLALEDSADSKYLKVWKVFMKSVVFEDVSAFEDRYQKCAEPWRLKWLEMYANPILNKFDNNAENLRPI
ncbi:MAG: hypothetical protein ACI9FB_003899 [Candidatus Azotimanducaceae bacterium]|jgi:hypothetical protein